MKKSAWEKSEDKVKQTEVIWTSVNDQKMCS